MAPWLLSPLILPMTLPAILPNKPMLGSCLLEKDVIH